MSFDTCPRKNEISSILLRIESVSKIFAWGMDYGLGIQDYEPLPIPNFNYNIKKIDIYIYLLLIAFIFIK
jgi:hypothetical protein